MTSDNPIDGPKGIGTAAQPVSPNEKTEAQTAQDQAKKTAEMGQEEFLTLLVNQLQHQDPLDPMDSEEFAVQLAQFSQLEQLISINNKLEGGADAEGVNPMASMASYLGHEVVLNENSLEVLEGKGSNLLLEVPRGTQSLRVDLMDEQGAVIGRHTIEDLEAGRQIVGLENLDVSNGKYDVRVVSVDSGGNFVDLDSKVTGTVEGFVLEPEPKLLVGGKEVSLEDVVEIHKGITS